ncbi:uncharacterized protein BDZ99DRAFT_288866 [Mytilinidion resinicola]|uniref:ChrR-like cupin domain-containing protein n=1 Tax=Mytilinidion resinicola TaxID=574789 RepID=A0A6A6YPH6_9PEZI|nr:uncharacterized protein BDZ99DRAFT_288866 [Mytilinidion resinicola]KAF2810782.1 hypothetical protein BDZ99DRAFT_288866 [Mytilinidion resinicola]
MHQLEFPATPPTLPNPLLPASENAPWRLIGPGTWELPLNHSASPIKEKSVLQYYEPHTPSITDAIITHTYTEEVVILKGSLTDVKKGITAVLGSYAFREPGMEHGPYRAGDEGVLQFVKVRGEGV